MHGHLSGQLTGIRGPAVSTGAAGPVLFGKKGALR